MNDCPSLEDEKEHWLLLELVSVTGVFGDGVVAIGFFG